MQAFNKYLRAATIVSSVLLVGGFVSYRAGAFNGLLEQAAPPPAVDDTTLGSESADAKHVIFLIDGTSKSGAIFRGDITTQQVQPTPPPRRAMMSGSKSVAPLLGGSSQPEQQPAAQAPASPPLPTSK